MAASDHKLSHRPSSGARECLAADALSERLDEEIARAERHRTALSCLLIGAEDLRTIEQTHGRALSEQALAYFGVALRREFRRFDRVGRPSEREFLVVLPGADGMRGEIVARRALARLRAIKLEASGVRRTLHVVVGIATWREGLTAAQLLASARLAAGQEPSTASAMTSGASAMTAGEQALDTSLPSGPLGFKDALRL